MVFLIGSLGLGGSERQLYLLLKHLDRERFDCRVLVFHPGSERSFQPVPGGRRCGGPPRSPRLHFHRPADGLPLPAASLAGSPRSSTPGRLHDNPYAGVVGRLAGVPLRIGSLRSSLHLSGFRSLPALFRRLALYSVDRITVNTEALRKELLAIDYPADRIAVLTNGVEIPEEGGAPPDLAEFGLSHGQPLIGLVANFRRVKNHLMFVQGLARSPAQISGGPGPDLRAAPGVRAGTAVTAP